VQLDHVFHAISPFEARGCALRASRSVDFMGNKLADLAAMRTAGVQSIAFALPRRSIFCHTWVEECAKNLLPPIP
jgi:hypothetical protein